VRFCPPVSLLLSPNPAPKYSVMIPIPPGSSHESRRESDIRIPLRAVHPIIPGRVTPHRHGTTHDVSSERIGGSTQQKKRV
jgi:hypothetical protein